MENLKVKLASSELSDRLSAVGTLRTLPAQEAIPLLEQAIQDTSARVRYAAVSLLGQMGGLQQRETMVSLLNTDPEFDVRAAAAAALGDLKDPEAIDALVTAYERDSEWLVRFSIVAALGEIAHPRAFDLLVEALDSEPLTRTVAAGALGQMGDLRAVPLLIKYTDDEDWQLRFRVAQSLGQLGTSEALEALGKLIHDPIEQVAEVAREALALALKK